MLIGSDYVEGLISKMRNIHKGTPPSFRRRENAAAIVKAPPPGALTKGPDRKFPGLHPPPGGATSPSLSTNRRFAIPILALLAALITCLVLLPGGPVQAQEVATGDGIIPFAENSTDPVRSFISTDPERDSVVWSIRGLDAADFTISSTGVLEFESPPNFEEPTDRALEMIYDAATHAYADNTPNDQQFDEKDNHYHITVSATEMSQALPRKRTDLPVTIQVMNQDDPGVLKLEWLEPEVGTLIRAILTDEDGGLTGATTQFTWSVSIVVRPDADIDLNWNPVTGVIGETGVITEVTGEDVSETTGVDSSYIPEGDNVVPTNDDGVEVDEGRFLRVQALYEDTQGVSKMAVVKSMLPVRAEVSTVADDPGGRPAENGSPDFVQEKDTRTVPEDTLVHAVVGDPFRAIEPDPEDTLTFTLEAVDLEDFASVTDAGHFYIDNLDDKGEITGTGQIKVKTPLDFDENLDANGNPDGKYVVRVRATDPAGEHDYIDVTITASNVNEPPAVTGQAELWVNEGVINALDEFVYNALPIGDEATPASSFEEHVYTATEQDKFDSIAKWHLEGDDADLFLLTGHFHPRDLQWDPSNSPAPDYENPRDMNKDNVYEVTIVATDTTNTDENQGRFDVTVVVGNVDEPGEVVFTEGAVPEFDQPLVAEVHDPDDHGDYDLSDADPGLGKPYEGVHIVTWQWSWAGTLNAEDDNFTDIQNATTNEYTPLESDRGRFLRVTATYTDPLSLEFDDTVALDERISTELPTDNPSLREVSETTANAVKAGADVVKGPSFTRDDDSGDAGSGSLDRYVNENSPADTAVGDAIEVENTAEDATFVYSLSGTDAQYFEIDDMTGQITVTGGSDTGKMLPDLNYEEKRKYEVTVTVVISVTDASDQTIKTDVDIHVRDVNESLIIQIEDEDGDPVSADAELTLTYPEIDEGKPNKAAILTFLASDPDAGNEVISWDVRGVDAPLFSIVGGVLMFKAPPDFENPKDGEVPGGAATPAAGEPFENTTPGGTEGLADDDNSYEIFVRAIERRQSGDLGPAQVETRRVTVQVLDVEEAGVVTIQWLRPEIGRPIEATLTDPDVVTAANPDGLVGVNITWVWTVSNVEQRSGQPDVSDDNHWRGGVEAGNPDDATYTPQEADTADFERFLRATATYSIEDIDIDKNGDPVTGAVSKTVHGRSELTVQEEGDGAENGSPNFVDESVGRDVLETAKVGDAIKGGAVTASVDAATTPEQRAKDTLTYSLRGVLASDNIVAADEPYVPPTGAATRVGVYGEDDELFSIDKETGVISVARKLDFETTNFDTERVDPDVARPERVYVVVATATDPSGADDSVVVLIRVDDVNETSTLDGRVELTINEIDSSDMNADPPLFYGNEATQARETRNNYYTAADEDALDQAASWILEGVDKAYFKLTQEPGRTLVFRDGYMQNYERPDDVGGDNVYNVTIVVRDNANNKGTFNVSVKVNNVNEAGTVTFVDDNGDEVTQPVAESAVTAVITDPDNPDDAVTDLTWQWSRHKNPASLTPSELTNMGEGTFSSTDGEGGDSAGVIADETGATYTPKNTDTAYFLRATASYMDHAADVTAVDDGRMKSQTTKHAVLEFPDLHQDPVFSPAAITIELAENSPTTSYVGAPLPKATDPDSDLEVLTYTLGEDNDEKYFELLTETFDHDGDELTDLVLLSERQVRIRPLVDLVGPMNPLFVPNAENDDQSEYTVVLIATDHTMRTGELTVTIMVTDRNEAPSEPKTAPEGLRIDGLDTISYPDAGMGEVETYQIAGPGAGDATATWTLTGNDRSDFTLNRSTGELNFRATPDFGNPADADRNNTYEITVNAAIADGDPLSMDVTITVTDVMEPNRAPEFSAATAARSVEEGTAAGGNVGSPITATDPDSGDTLTYALSGTDMASFTVDNMGQIMVGAGTMLDYETKASYMVTVTASDGIAS